MARAEFYIVELGQLVLLRTEAFRRGRAIFSPFRRKAAHERPDEEFDIFGERRLLELARYCVLGGGFASVASGASVHNDTDAHLKLGSKTGIETEPEGRHKSPEDSRAEAERCSS